MRAVLKRGHEKRKPTQLTSVHCVTSRLCSSRRIVRREWTRDTSRHVSLIKLRPSRQSNTVHRGTAAYSARRLSTTSLCCPAPHDARRLEPSCVAGQPERDTVEAKGGVEERTDSLKPLQCIHRRLGTRDDHAYLTATGSVGRIGHHVQATTISVCFAGERRDQLT